MFGAIWLASREIGDVHGVIIVLVQLVVAWWHP